ncbi:hypothetical protein FGRMN_7660 [Fusarium graminum]|nr:hypothetical protein FGRMN_7660 [Fusarium graminum]
MTSFIPRDSVQFSMRLTNIEQRLDDFTLSLKMAQLHTEVSSPIAPLYAGAYCYHAGFPLAEAYEILGNLTVVAKFYFGHKRMAITCRVTEGLESNRLFSVADGLDGWKLENQFRGQSGFIEFDTSVRLPRHVHILSIREGGVSDTLIHERIFVIGGVALVELGGEIYVIPPQTLVTIAPGVPHTWIACPKGVKVSKNTGSHETEQVISQGKFMMLYEYEEITGFFPTKQTDTLKSVGDYVRPAGS